MRPTSPSAVSPIYIRGWLATAGQPRVYDALVLGDGKILYHFAGVMYDQTPADANEEGTKWPSR
jgi:hypothetical protein